MKSQTWDEMHSEPKVLDEAIIGKATNLTKSGICKFGKDDNLSGMMVESLHGKR